MVSRIFSSVLPVTDRAGAGVVDLAVVQAAPAPAARGVSLRQRTGPHANLCLPGDGITAGGRAAGRAWDSRRDADGRFEVPRSHWAFLDGGTQYDHLPSGRRVRAAEVCFQVHQPFALDLHAVEVNGVADVKSAMSKIIAIAPAEADVAPVLLLAITPQETWPRAGFSPKKGPLFAAVPSTQEFPKRRYPNLSDDRRPPVRAACPRVSALREGRRHR